MAIFFLS